MNGFTLLETVVILSILSLMALLVITGWPKTRDWQALLLAEQYIQAQLHQAQQLAFHEERSATCGELFSIEDEDRKRCSDVGVALKGSTLRLFADTTGNNRRYNDSDFILEEKTLPGGVITPGNTWQSLLFAAEPPHITLFSSNGEAIGANQNVTITLQAGETSAIIRVLPYGQLQRQ